jgi:pyocin large subunit-like protein
VPSIADAQPPIPPSHPRTTVSTGHGAIDSPTKSRFFALNGLPPSQSESSVETTSTFRLGRSFLTSSPAMRRSINTMLSEEFVSVPSKQRIAIQQALDSLSNSFFNSSASSESSFSDEFEQKSESGVDDFVKNAS